MTHTELQEALKRFRKEFHAYIYGIIIVPEQQLMVDLEAFLEHELTLSQEQAVREKQWIGIYDRKGKKVYNGDIVGLPYIPPIGEVGLDDELVYKAKIVFEHATYMLEMIDYDSYTENIQVIDWLIKEKGEYISNYGEKTIITNKAKFEVIESLTPLKEKGK